MALALAAAGLGGCMHMAYIGAASGGHQETHGEDTASGCGTTATPTRLLLHAPGHAADFDPIPPAVWQMKEQPEEGITGAVVLEDALSLEWDGLERAYRVRVLGDSGRAAAEFPPFPEEAAGIKGRVVYPDGREVRFGKKDMTAIQAEPQELASTPVERLVPPGVTHDCVVEIRWRESGSRDGPLPRSYGFIHQWVFGHPYPTRLTSVRIAKNYPWPYSFDGPPTLKVEVADRSWIIRDLPPTEAPPFSLPTLRPTPRLTVFAQRQELVRAAREGDAAFWEAAGRLLAEERRDVKKGKHFQAFATEILADTPADPLEKAIEIRARLERRIVNASFRTWEERDQPVDLPSRFGRLDLDAIVKAGMVEASRFELLYLHLLREADLAPRVALVPARARMLFNPRLRSISQLGTQLVGVGGPGGPPSWLDASLRFAHPLLILPAYQGAEGLEIDIDSGVARSVTIPVQPASFNVRHFDYQLEPEDADDEVRFRGTARFEGFPEFVERLRYMKLAPGERDTRLRDTLEETLSEGTLDRAVVRLPVPGEAGRVGWELGGRLPLPSSRSVTPFPAMVAPLRVPEHLPAKRTQPIVISYGLVHDAVSEIRLPGAMRAAPAPAIGRRNSFGRVDWLAESPAPGVVRVRLRVELRGGAFKADAYPELREYLGWVQDATSRVVGLEPVP